MDRITIDNLALPPDELACLVDANAKPSMAETVMRMRALAELSRHAPTGVLLALASLAAEGPAEFADLVAALGRPRS